MCLRLCVGSVCIAEILAYHSSCLIFSLWFCCWPSWYSCQIKAKKTTSPPSSSALSFTFCRQMLNSLTVLLQSAQRRTEQYQALFSPLFCCLESILKCLLKESWPFCRLCARLRRRGKKKGERKKGKEQCIISYVWQIKAVNIAIFPLCSPHLLIAFPTFQSAKALMKIWWGGSMVLRDGWRGGVVRGGMERGMAAEGGWRERKYTLSLFLGSVGDT